LKALTGTIPVFKDEALNYYLVDCAVTGTDVGTATKPVWQRFSTVIRRCHSDVVLVTSAIRIASSNWYVLNDVFIEKFVDIF
jgi:hypothetical protein